MPNSKTIFAISFLMIFLASSGICADTKSPEAKAPEPSKPDRSSSAAPDKELTKREMVDRINSNLDSFPEILNFVPGLKKETGPAGKITYTYHGKNIGALEAEQLSGIYSRVNNESVRLRTDRINRQLDNIRRIDEINRQNRQLIRTPKIPTPPPRLPKIPRIPPALPRR
ncbi:MAG: hypothetical protein Q7S07_03760 [Candidatus Omnitrophota bacterium]|nr:hypothetical protein [Candidatus Omnitrophota bacterium]